MSFLVVVGVVTVVFFYVRSTRQARLSWLKRVDLVGTWEAQDTAKDTRLTLEGRADRGDFVLRAGADHWHGIWQMRGHQLCLEGEGRAEQFELHVFKPGCIGLEASPGKRQIYNKMQTNVVSLDAARESKT